MSTLLHPLGGHVSICRISREAAAPAALPRLPSAWTTASSGAQRARRFQSSIVRLKLSSPNKDHHLKVAIQRPKAKSARSRFAPPPKGYKSSIVTRERTAASSPSSPPSPESPNATPRWKAKAKIRSARARAHRYETRELRNDFVHRVRDVEPVIFPEMQWEGSMLFVDCANCGFTGPGWMSRLAQFGASKGCHVLGMVEGDTRNIIAPPGLHLIRADPIKRPDIGDDALVAYVNRALNQGIQASDCILVTDDRGLRGRMRVGVHKRPTKWLKAEMLSEGLEWRSRWDPEFRRTHRETPARREHLMASMERRRKRKAEKSPRTSRKRQRAVEVKEALTVKEAVRTEKPTSFWSQGWIASLWSLFAGTPADKKSGVQELR